MHWAISEKNKKGNKSGPVRLQSYDNRNEMLPCNIVILSLQSSAYAYPLTSLVLHLRFLLNVILKVGISKLIKIILRSKSGQRTTDLNFTPIHIEARLC